MLEHYGFFYLRTPTLPLRWLDDLYGASNPEVFLEEALKRPEIQSILWASCPKLMAAWDQRSGDKEIALKLITYIVRAAGRATPSGLLAGCSIGRISQHSKLEGSEPKCRVWVDLDAKTQERCAAASLSVRKINLIAINPNVQFLEDIVLLEETKSAPIRLNLQKKLVQFLKAVPTSPLPTNEIRDLVRKKFRVDGVASKALIQELLKFRIFIEVGPDTLILDRPGLQCNSLTKKISKSHVAVLRTVHGKELSSVTDEILTLARRYLKDHAEINRPLHFELTKEHSEVHLSEKSVSEISRSIEALHLLFYHTHRQREPSSYWIRSVAKMNQIFDQSYVPIKKLLGVYTNSIAPELDSPNKEDPKLKDFLYTFILSDAELLKSDKKVYQIKASDIEYLKSGASTSAPSFNAAAKSLSAHIQFVRADGKDLIWLKGVAGGTSVSWLARFAYFHRELRIHLKKIVKNEKRLFGMPTDVACIYDTDCLNVSRRPNLFGAQIAGNHFSPSKKRLHISLDDLLVSSNGHFIKIFSKTLNRFIRPSHASNLELAHCPTEAIKFLTLVGMQDWLPSVYWSWAGLRQVHFPRVQYGGVVLVPEQWRLPRKVLESLLTETSSLHGKLKKLWGVPRWVALAQGDRYLPLDLESGTATAILKDQMGRDREIILIEYWKESPVSLGGDQYLAEAVIPLFLQGPSLFNQQLSHRLVPFADPARMFTPTSNCAFFVIYCNENAHDSVLLKLRKEILCNSEKFGISRWFLVRYDYPRVHLRLRFFPSGAKRIQLKNTARIAQIFRSWQDQGWISGTQLETYSREIETYGGVEGAKAFEEFSWIDSEWTLDFLAYYDSIGTSKTDLGGWPSADHIDFAFYKVKKWMALMELTPVEITEILSANSHAGRNARVAVSEKTMTAIHALYREKRSIWAQCLSGASPIPSYFDPHERIALAYEHKFKIFYRGWRKNQTAGLITIELAKLVNRMIHLGLNRIGLKIDEVQERDFALAMLKAYKRAWHGP